MHTDNYIYIYYMLTVILKSQYSIFILLASCRCYFKRSIQKIRVPRFKKKYCRIYFQTFVKISKKGFSHQVKVK